MDNASYSDKIIHDRQITPPFISTTAFMKRAHDPIDYEGINDIEFWIMEEDTNATSIIDFNEIETLLYNGKSIHTVALDNEQAEKVPIIEVEAEGLNLDSFPQKDVNIFIVVLMIQSNRHAWLIIRLHEI
ncbi:hypothetical protein MTR_8g100150 [Medicago truncatula]|uniref:Uncharacterized protein n=2 Tax=Medicago truncatula TaxID=3880 RepID=G7LIU2_MEDTR|nr:hypothetical protein MTR_8g100150 [Medicago truncatula]